MAHIGYQQALDMAKKELAEKKPETVAANTGVIWNGSTYVIPWFHEQIPLDEGRIEEQIIWHHYLLTQGPKLMRDRYINYKQVPGAAIYNDNFMKRAVNPMVSVFGSRLDAFQEKGEMLGGTPADLGHRAFTLHPLPYLPVTYVLWEGDDEFPASGNILFDETAIDWFCAEDLVVIASLPVYRMMKM